MEPYYVGWFSLFVLPVLAICLPMLVSKEVVSSLLVGIIRGTLFIYGMGLNPIAGTVGYRI